jgi:large subunit ribosomal protein L15
MTTLSNLKDTARKRKPRKRVGRGVGSKSGKTCGRGEKGMGSRSGAKKRWGKEGGNMPLFMKIPIRGFSNFNFRREYDVVNLDQIEAVFEEGEEVNLETLLERGLISGSTPGVKLLGNGEITKKLAKIELNAMSKTARDKITQAGIPFEVYTDESSSD